MSDDDDPEVIFVPGAFDEFTGTQEELDALIAEIKRLAKAGLLIDEPIEGVFIGFELEDDDEEYDFIPDPPPKRTLN